MDKVEWRVKGLFKADAQKVFEEIGDNKFNYKEIIEKAKSEDSELHKCFEWDDSIAADKYRLSQARLIVQNLVFTAKDVEVQPLRVFQITQEKNVYQPTRVFLENKEEYEGLLSRKGYNATEYMYVEEDEQAILFIHKESKERIWVEK